MLPKCAKATNAIIFAKAHFAAMAYPKRPIPWGLMKSAIGQQILCALMIASILKWGGIARIFVPAPAVYPALSEILVIQRLNAWVREPAMAAEPIAIVF